MAQPEQTRHRVHSFPGSAPLAPPPVPTPALPRHGDDDMPAGSHTATAHFQPWPGSLGYTAELIP